MVDERSFSVSSIQTLTRIGSLLEARVESTTAVIYAALWEPSLVEPEFELSERDSGSHFAWSTSAT